MPASDEVPRPSAAVTPLESSRGAYEQMRADQATNIGRWLRQLPSTLAVLKQSTAREIRAVIPAHLVLGHQMGKVHLGEAASGGLTANLHDSATGKIVGQARLVEAAPAQLAELQQLALQHSLAEIARQLDEIERQLERVLAGQIDDRLALVDSGVHLYWLASRASGDEARGRLLIEAMGQLSQGRAQLIRSLAAPMEALSKLPTSQRGIRWAALRRDLPAEAARSGQALEVTFDAAMRGSAVMALACARLGETQLLRDAWQPLAAALPQLEAAHAMIERWTPGDERRLPDRLGTRLAMAGQIVATGQALEAGQDQQLEILLAPEPDQEAVNE